MFRKLLVANRGEIALRVIRACRDLGIQSVAIYSEADRAALHVRQADEAYLIGPPPPRESYLNIPRIIEVAKKAGVDAIHPGYGFLAENAAFAQACQDNGITFVGPSPEVIGLMGDKLRARQVMREAGVPVVPGTGQLRDTEEALAAAREIGFPLLVKAAAGGGGRGMRTVTRAEELASALELARREAGAAFGDDTLYIEKLLSPVRHIEVQVIGDLHGNVVVLGERECSIQRRHQKLIEEAPSAAVDQRRREYLQELATLAARHVGYYSAGTLEFLLDSQGNFYFLEMNTRLQVEHPVTELVTGVDLVVDQILVAAGEPLGYCQADVQLRGWAIECRINAEDPYSNFRPSAGTLHYVRLPGGPGVRVDSALDTGVDVAPYYDPLIAKLITWGRDRQQAITRMKRALAEFKVVGVSTNIPFHMQVMNEPAFVAGKFDTGFVEKHFQAQRDSQREERAAMLLAALLAHSRRRAPRPAPVAAPESRWRLRGRLEALGQAPWSVRERNSWRRST
jgi:acetyl-CoA carboxylase biotin carboxylase subunit